MAETVYNSKDTTTVGAFTYTSLSAPTVVGSTALYGALAGSNTVAASTVTASGTPSAAANVLTVIGSSTTGNVVQFSTTAGSNFIMTNAGRIGINTVNPAYTLDVNGNLNFSGAISQGGTPLPSSQWTTLGSNIYYLSNVSIGSVNYNVTNSGVGAYVINGASNPTLTVIRGATYTFTVNASGHPFWIQTTSGAYNSGTVYSSGITNGGAQVGTITWTVLYDAPSTLYYVCQYHSAMNGIINVVNSPSTTANRLLVAGNIATTSNINFPQGGLLSGQPSAVDWSIQNSGGALNFTRNSTTSFLRGGTLQLSQYGMVGIQLGNPTALLHIGANTVNTTDMFHIQTYAGTTLFKVQATGGVGLGVATPAYQLDLSTDGARKLSTTSWITGSDSRIKSDIQSANVHRCYDIVNALDLKYFKWDFSEDVKINDKCALGFIAQEVREIFPKAVTSSNSYGFSDFLSLDTDQIFKAMYGALKKTMQDKEELEKRVLALETAT